MTTAVELRFHPDETSPLSMLSPSEGAPNAYITRDAGIITISFFYPENMAIGTGWSFFPRATELGYHRHDIEHVSIYFEGDKPSMVYFSAHNSKQGTWVKWEDCERSKNGNLIVYVARGSHANYPHAGTYWRVFGTANDVCSARGPSLVLPLSLMIPSYDYRFDNGIALYKGLRPTPPPQGKVLTSWQRFLLPLNL
jgi:hypothetical protein